MSKRLQVFERNFTSDLGIFFFDMNICLYSDLFNCSRNAGVITEDIAKPTLTAQAKERAREELLGRTGETDSEMEMD